MKYTPSQREKLFKKVIKELQKGRSLRKILKDDQTPSRTALYSWLDEDAEYAERFARAMEIGDEVLEEQKLEIAETRLVETVEEIGRTGKTPFTKIITRDNVQRSKLMIETIDKILARRNPRKYGNKLDLTSAGEALAVPAIVGMSIINKIAADDTDEQEARPENNNDLF